MDDAALLKIISYGCVSIKWRQGLRREPAGMSGNLGRGAAYNLQTEALVIQLADHEQNEILET